MKSNKLVMTLVAFTVVNFVVVQEWRMNDMKNQLELSAMRAKVNADIADELIRLQVNDVEKVRIMIRKAKRIRTFYLTELLRVRLPLSIIYNH